MARSIELAARAYDQERRLELSRPLCPNCANRLTVKGKKIRCFSCGIRGVVEGALTKSRYDVTARFYDLFYKGELFWRCEKCKELKRGDQFPIPNGNSGEVCDICLAVGV
jgi:hypothetical protein